MTFLKKIYLLLLSAILLLTSCSKDSANNNEITVSNGLKKPRKMTITDDSGYTQIVTFQYEGDNLKKYTMSNHTNVPECFYQNNILTEFKELANTSEKYFYDNTGKLIQVLEVAPNYYFRADFKYNTGSNKINSAKFYRSPTNFWKSVSYNYDSNGNVIKITSTAPNAVLNRTYDNKNNPFVNVNWELEDHDLLRNDWYQSSKNNCISASGGTSSGGSGSATFTYTYDSDNFPITRIEKNGSTIIETITYQY
jgi:hypothetical protein